MINVICVHTAMALVEPLTKIFAERGEEGGPRGDAGGRTGRRVPQSQ